jgi:ABC-type multidrug transport system fused ATPase/permease subunit
MFFILAIAAFFFNLISAACFGIAGEKLTRRMREKAFEAILKQEMAFFDNEKNSTGALSARLAEDANMVKELVGRSMSTIVQTLVTMISTFVYSNLLFIDTNVSSLAGLTIAFCHGWDLTLIVLTVVPLIAVAGIMQMRSLTGFGNQSKSEFDDASVISNEAIDNIRTVLTLTRETMFLKAYEEGIEKPYVLAVKGIFIGAIGYGMCLLKFLG